MLAGVFAACGAQKTAKGWEDAVYTEDASFGEGAKTVTVKVIVGEKTVTFTVKTDKEDLASALLEHGLVEGEDGQFGLYIKKVNGILADYDVDQTYWSLSSKGEILMTGASGVTVSDGDVYEFTKAQ
jgi:hypothetical protein